MQKTLFSIAIATSLLSGCDFPMTSDRLANSQQEQLSLQSVQAVGMPAIVNFAEKRMMKDILERRDRNVVTTTYIIDMNGRLHKLCNSVGYGLPYSTQYTNPMKISDSSYHLAMPQADPNGLFSPASAEGTWVLCINPATKQAEPLYIEPRIIVSPFPFDN